MGTLTPEQQTLAAGDLVWAKSKGRPWWPARLRADSLVAYLGDDAAAPTRAAANLKRFADPDADHMARASTARAFLAAVHDAQAQAVDLLQAHLTCACASDSDSPPPPPPLTIGVGNLAPSEFLDALCHAALDASSVGLVDLARLKSWARALALGWGPDGAGRYHRRAVDDLVDKIDLDVLAGEHRDAADWVDHSLDQDTKPYKKPQETPAQKRRSVASLIEDMDVDGDDDGEDGKVNDGGSANVLFSNKRERKKSKYLSPPYTNLARAPLLEKVSDSPKVLLLTAAAATAEDESKVLPDNVGAEEVLQCVRRSGNDVYYRGRSLKAAKAFLALFRSSLFAEDTDYKSYNEHKCLAKNAGANVGANVSAGLVTDPPLALNKGKCGLKRSRKSDQHQDGAGSSSIKKNKREKTSPAASLGCGVSITPAVPIRQVRAEDIVTQMKPGIGARAMGTKVKPEKKKKNKKSVLNSPISAPVVQAIKPGHEQDQANGDSVLKTAAGVGNNLSGQSAKEHDQAMMEAEKLETDIQADRDVQGAESAESEPKIPVDTEKKSADVDVLVNNVPMELKESEPSIPVDTDKQGASVDVLVRGVPMESMESERNIPVDTDKQGAVVDVRNETLPQCEDIPLSQSTEENNEQSSVEVRTVQESYASLEAMVPEMLNKVEVTDSSTIAALSHALIGEGQRVIQQPSQKMTDGVSGNHSSGVSANGTFPDLANSTPKKKNKKKTAQHFGNPAALLLDFAPGVILPSKERLLSEFRRFGFLIESETAIVEGTHSARVVFGKSAEAEAAYTSADTLGMFGPPYATPRLNYLPPIKLSMPSPSPSPASKPPLVDIRKNLEKMISSLSGPASLKNPTSSDGSKPAALLGEMQGLLAKVDKMISGPSTPTSTPH